MRTSLRVMPGLGILLGVLVAVVLTAFPVSLRAQGQKDYAEFGRLAVKARSEGSVRVIVQLDVPDVRKLAAASAKFDGMSTSRTAVSKLMAADEALANGISQGAARVKADLDGTDHAVERVFTFIPYMSLRVSADALARLEASPAVLGIEEDVPTGLIEPVPDREGSKAGNELTDETDLAGPQLDNTVALIGAKTAWGWGYTGSGWYVAILDTGIRRTHQFFSGKTVREACFAQGATGPGDCPNGTSTMTGTNAARHYPSSYSGYDHGTHVAGIAAGKYGSLAGVAKNANVIAVQVFSKFPASYCGSKPCVLSWGSDQLAGLQHVYSLRSTHKIGAVNMSLGGGQYRTYCSSSLKTAIDALRNVKIATVIATGNNGWCGSTGAPACISSAVAIGASDDSDQEAYFSNWHKSIQKLFAPGVNIKSSTGMSNGSYGSWNGTSMATPHAAGAFTLMRHAFPTKTVSEILALLRAKGKLITSACGSTKIPRIQVDKAIRPTMR